MMIQVVVAMTVLLIAFGYYDYTSTKDQLVKDLNQQIAAVEERLKISLPGPIWDYAPEFIIKNIQSEMSTPAVAGIKVVSNDKEILGLVARRGNELILNKDEPSSSSFTKQVDVKLFYDDDGEQQQVGQVFIFENENVIKPALQRTMAQAIIQGIVMDIIVALAIFFILSGNVMRPLSQVTAAINDIAQGEGDLTKRLDDSKGDEISQLAAGFNQFVEQLQDMVRNISERSNLLQESSQQTSQIVDNTNQGWPSNRLRSIWWRQRPLRCLNR